MFIYTYVCVNIYIYIYIKPHICIYIYTHTHASMGKGVFQFLPFKLVPPAASPPVKAKKEIQDSKVLDQIVKATDTPVRLYSNGAPAWPSLCDVKGIKNFQVKHYKFQFVKRLPGMKKPASVVVAGTQVIDHWWQAMDAFIPPQIHNKKGKGGPVNDLLISCREAAGDHADTLRCFTYEFLSGLCCKNLSVFRV